MRRAATATALVLAALAVCGAAAPAGGSARDRPPLPARMADTGGGSQLLTAEAPHARATRGTLTWWERRGGRWTAVGSAPARFGAAGLTEGTTREQGGRTTPTGLFDLPYAFGIRPAPAGTTTAYRRVTGDSWWCEDTRSAAYNRWSEPLAADCRASESERLASYDPQYRLALVVGFNYERPVRGRGAGIFLHVNGEGATAGCVSVPEEAMRRVLDWAEPGRHPHLAIGTTAGATALTRY
ncbi:L,D-transpeptidase [Streptomyces sp. SCSIO ZS0520]|uniref:L,D-transpeptidase family protein n=1 Tax=Streptomyces sp. SCSIO ZS0520 TaxID=2892996 RepID=UPI0021D99E4B|nr:L,D-transpeptidase family protein [Streptomyces sp. SCSIO ZS0520]